MGQTINFRWTFAIVILLLMAVASCGPEVDSETGEGILFADSFTDNTFSDAWRFSGDVADVAITEDLMIGPAGGQVDACIGEADWTDYNIRFWGDASNGSMTVHFRHTAWAQTYGFYIIQEGQGNFFTRYNNDPRTLTDSIRDLGDEPFELLIEVRGNKFGAYQDDELLYEFTDDALASGEICFNMIHTFRLDSVLITEP